MSLDSLRDLYIHQLKDVYSAEKQIKEALPKMADAASSADLQKAFRDHLKETEQQIERLSRIFTRLGVNPGNKMCKGMEGLIHEGEEIIKEDGSAAVKDAGLITAAQRVEHYEIAAYGTLRTYANMMGDDEITQLLQESLDEEGEADKKLTMLAESHINAEAMRS